MSGIVRIRCPECKEWMTRGEDLCGDCHVFLLKIRGEDSEE